MEDKANDHNMKDQDEAEETLSFCDLPMYSDAAEWQNFSKEEQRLSSSDQDFFEFFSEDWGTSNAYPVLENIVFCGKLIPFKEPISDTTHKIESNKQKKPRKRGFFRWNSRFFRRRRTSKPTGPKGRCMNKTNQPLRYVSSSKSLSDKYAYKSEKGGAKYGFSVRRVSIFTSPAKSRWHLLMFGFPRLSAEMELRDIRSRQSRRSPAAMFRLQSGDDDENIEKVSRGKRLWWLIRALGCGGDYHHHHHHHHANAVVKA